MVTFHTLRSKSVQLARIKHNSVILPLSFSYRHFANFNSKDQIMDATLDLTFDRLLGNVADVCREVLGPFERLLSPAEILFNQAIVTVQQVFW
jgi:hypothetical protein